MFSLESFCNSIWGISYSKVLRKIDKSDYREFQIPKKGGVRTINYLGANSPLEEIQRLLLVNFLNKQELPVCVKGFRKGESYRSFLEDHVGADYYLRIDISSFFPSINENFITKEFSRIVTCNSPEEKEKILKLICDIVLLDNKRKRQI